MRKFGKFAWIITAQLLFCLGSEGASIAATTLKQVQVSGSTQIDLLFDGKISTGQIQTEFFNDIIQLSLIDVSVYPAKISSVNGGVLSKIFAYQYAPRLVRCRLTVSGQAESYKDRLQISPNGKVLTIKIGESAVAPVTDKVKVSSAMAVRGVETKERPAAPGAEAAELKISASEEKALLEHVIKGTPRSQPAVAKEEAPIKTELKVERKKAGAFPSPWGVLMKLTWVLALFGVFAIFLKKLGSTRKNRYSAKATASLIGSRWGGLSAALGGLARSSLGKLGHKDKMIEVLSTHHLGPKQSIAVVLVCGRKMVLGIANDSISLISQLNDEELSADPIEDDKQGVFAKYLSQSQVSPELTSSLNGPQFVSQKAAPRNTAAPVGTLRPEKEMRIPTADSVRSRIRSRLEGFKSL